MRMTKGVRWLIGVVAVVALLLYGWFLYHQYPQPLQFKTAKFVPENRVKTLEYTEKYVEDGEPKTRTIKRDIQYTVCKPVFETRIIEVKAMQKLQFWFLAIVIAVFALLTLTFLGLWLVDKINRTKPDAHTRENRNNLAIMVAFIFGAAGSLFGVILDSTPDVERMEMKAELDSLRQLITSGLYSPQPPNYLPVPNTSTNMQYGPSPPLEQTLEPAPAP